MFIHTALILLTQPGADTIVLIALVAPVLILLLLIATATIVALIGGRERGRRARLILSDLLDALSPRRRGGRR